MSDAPLTLDPEAMRALGYRVVDRIVEHHASLADGPVTAREGREALEALLREPMPEEGRPAEEVLERAMEQVFPRTMRVDHPRFFAFVPGPSNFVSAMADALVAGMNVFQGTWLASSGPSEVELVTVDWLREACGLPAGAGGLFVSGGSMANVTCLGVARRVRLGDRAEGATVYLSDQTHASVDRALRVLGFRDAQLRRVPTDAEFRIDVGALERAIGMDRGAGLDPAIVVANAGTTNTGAVDPLPALAGLCAAERLWLHADGAYGAAAALCERGREALAGLGRVDSLSLDPHKWLFQPFECGCALVRDARGLAATYAVHPEYLQDTRLGHEEVNFGERGIQLTRQFRALKLWMSLQVFGRRAFAAAVERGFRLAELAEAELRRTPGWEVVTRAGMGVVTFRRDWPGEEPREVDRRNVALVEALFRDGHAFLSSTVLRGRAVLRMCTINPRTTPEDVRSTVRRLDELSRDAV